MSKINPILSIFILLCTWTSCFAVEPVHPKIVFNEKQILFSCLESELKEFFIPDLYEWIKTAGNISNSQVAIEKLESVPYQNKLERIADYCKEQKLTHLYLSDKKHAPKLIEHILGAPLESEVILSCKDLQRLPIPNFYRWLRNSSRFRNIEKIINLLDRISYEEKIIRLRNFCKDRRIDFILSYSYDDELVTSIVNHLFYEQTQHLLPSATYSDSRLSYDPTSHHPELSYAYANQDKEKKVFLVKSKSAPNQWQETCLAAGGTHREQFADCYQSDKTRLTLSFENRTRKNEFKIKHQNNCLTKANTLTWETCTDKGPKQYFERRVSTATKDNSYLKFNLFHPATNSVLFDGAYVHFRDSFPRVQISPPLSYLPKREEIKSFIEGNEFHSKKRPDIFLVWIDTTRADVVSPEIMPNLYNFSKNYISFKKTYAGATATRPSGFTLWNSRPSTEWRYFQTYGYGREGSINLNILKNLGYEVHAFASILPVIDENLFDDFGAFFRNGENFINGPIEHVNDRVFFHRNVFDFKNPIEKRELNIDHTLSISEYKRLSPIEHDEKVVDFFIDEVHKPGDNPKTFLLWLTGPHTPYLSAKPKSLPPTFSDLPAFTPYFQDHYELLKKPLWNSWFYDYEKLGTGITHPSSVVNSYIKSAASSDLLLGKLIHSLKQTGKYDDSLIVVISDHGESLFENGYLGHGGPTLQKVIEVPLYYKFPLNEIQQEDVQSQVGTQMDIFPTIFDYLGVEISQKNVQKNVKTKNLNQLITGTSILKDRNPCQISSEPNGYSYSTVEFSLFNGEEKLRARFHKKEKTPNTYLPDENPLRSEYIEPIAYTDYWDNPLNAGQTINEINETFLLKFSKCFEKFFP